MPRCPVRFEWDHQQHEILQKTRSSSSNVHWNRWGAWRVLQCKPSSWNWRRPGQLPRSLEEARKFITRSMRRLKEMEEERQVEERLFGGTRESQEDIGGAGEGSQPPSTVTGHNFTDNRPPTDGEHVAGRTRQSGGGVARMRRVEKLHPPQSSEGSENPRERAARRQACGPEDIPNSEQELTEWMCTKHLEL